ncbi:PAS domain-containing hybrid sensor histidine kinase/response regulator [Pedobacter sp. UBA4863]|uniref:PAS domain-containing hybrid sensor histidine kinase/response regulator n=1 Tax=Pedobacter sp. UBA4863 TaxID=1947060 RepID=UPI0025FE3079|nr:PAS domain-containing hybrid sensor histidine kinase/response regulator [Pedobacter sp. UBA4863]
MISPSPTSSTEEQRLAALYSYDMLGEGLENELDNLVKLAAQIAATKKACIAFVDRQHIVFKASFGLLTKERVFLREDAISQFALYKSPYIVPNVKKAREFANSLSVLESGMVFYASIPLKDADGFSLGFLCVIGDEEKSLSPLQIEALQTLAVQVIAQLTLRRKNLQLLAQTKRSEEFVDVFQASPEVHCILNREGDILFINEAVNTMLGYHVSEIQGKSMWSFCYKDDIAKITAHLQQGLQSKAKHFVLDFRVVDSAGKIKWLSWSMVSKNDRWYSYGRDITEKKRLDMELTHLSFVASKVNNGVVISDDYNRVSWANDAFTEITGFTLQDIQGKPLGDLIRGPETDWAVIEEARKLTSEKKSFTVDVLAYKKDKTKIWLSIYSTIILSADGEVETEIEIIIDITAKKKAEQELEVLSTVASKTHTGVAICDKNGEITWVNEALEQLIGYSAAELSGKMLGDVLSNDETDRQVILQARAASEHKKSFSIEVLAQKKDGTSIWLAVANTPIINSKNKIERYIELITDITERKQVERDIIQAKEQATQLSEAKEMFLSVMSHEIRTPLNAIIGMTHLLIENDPKPSQTEDLNILKFSGENLLNIINDVLDFTKIETGNLHLEYLPVNLQLLCNDIISSLKVNATKQQNILSLNFDKQIPTLVSADKLRLYQVLMNLLGNAIKFTTNGRVELTVKMQHESTTKVDVYFEVKDNGIGIPLDKKDYIFETFTQARADISRKYGGTGLGLAITKKLLKLYQSDIKVDSVEGKGASFSFVIGFDKVTQVETQEKLRPVVFDGKRVLIVDDNEINILIAKRILIKWGLVLDFAADGYEAIEKITKNKYDLVFMDIKMPGITGFETTTIIRGMEEKYYKTLPIVALTASTLHNEESKFKESGMNGHILKPFNPSEIKKVLAQFLV